MAKVVSKAKFSFKSKERIRNEKSYVVDTAFITERDDAMNGQNIGWKLENITYVESYAHYLLIHTLNSTVKVREKISVALQKLEPLGFIQVHRSYVINHDRIKKIDTDNITLSDETIIPIGKKYKQALKNH